MFYFNTYVFLIHLIQFNLSQVVFKFSLFPKPANAPVVVTTALTLGTFYFFITFKFISVLFYTY